MAKELVVDSVAGGITGIINATLIPVNPGAGQIGYWLRYVSGGSLEIGGASLVAGNGFLVSATAGHPYLDLPIGGTFYLIASGTTCVITYMKQYGLGSAGQQG